MPTERVGGGSSTAGSGSGSVAPEPVLPRRNLTRFSLEAQTGVRQVGEFFVPVDVPPWSYGMTHRSRVFA